MLNTVYRLVAPRRFEVAFNDIDLNSDKVVVRPTHFMRRLVMWCMMRQENSSRVNLLL